MDLAALAAGPDNHQTKAVESVVFLGLERFKTGRIAIVDGNDFAGPAQFKDQVIVGSRSQGARSIGNSGGNEAQVLPFMPYNGSIGGQ